MNSIASIEVLKPVWLEAKRRETQANTERLEIEQQILAHFPKDVLEGTSTNKEAGISVSFGVTRKVDTDKLQEGFNALPTNAQKAFKWAASVDTKQLKALQDLDPSSYSQCAAFITTTPKKPSIAIKE